MVHDLNGLLQHLVTNPSTAMYKESSFEVSMFLGGVLCEIIGPNLDELGRSLVIFLGENEEFSL